MSVENEPEANDTEHMTVEQWLAIRKEAGLRIDPETAEVMWSYEYVADPYGVDPGACRKNFK